MILPSRFPTLWEENGQQAVISPLKAEGLDFLDEVGEYAHFAFEAKEKGADYLICAGFSGLQQMRAAVLGAKQTNLPIVVLLEVDEEGKTLQQCDALAALVTLQWLGADVFALQETIPIEDLADILERLYPYARIPLAVSLRGANHRPAELEQLMCAGVEIIEMATANETQKAEMRVVINRFNPANLMREKDEEAFLAANSFEAFNITVDMTTSEPIECNVDMADDFIEAERTGCDAVCIHVSTVEDAKLLEANADMARLPVAILADNAEALEAALLRYAGRAIVDMRSDVEEETRRGLAKGYGAIRY